MMHRFIGPYISITVTDKLAVIKPDQTYEIDIDRKTAAKGILGHDDTFEPALEPPTEIDDPNDVKPDDWVDDAQVCLCLLWACMQLIQRRDRLTIQKTPSPTIGMRASPSSFPTRRL